MAEILEIDASTVLVDGDDIDFASATSVPRVTQTAIIGVAEPTPQPSRVTELAVLSVQSPAGIETRLPQLAIISVAANNRDYIQLENPFSLPCFDPCQSYGTFATIIRI